MARGLFALGLVAAAALVDGQGGPPSTPCAPKGIPHSDRDDAHPCSAAAAGGTCVFTCDTGYVGSGTVICQASGVFTDGACSAKPCRSTSVPHTTDPSGTTTCTGVTGDTCAYTCAGGYHTMGSGTMICQTSGEFSAGSCAPNPCQSKTIPHTTGPGGTTTCTGSTTDTCSYTCAAGYGGDHGGSGTVTCEASGAFSAGSCAPNPCQSKTISHTTAPGGSTTCTGSMTDTCSYTCADGYGGDHGGSGTMICQATGVFSAGSCAPNPCQDLPIAHTREGTTTCTGRTTDTCSYTCADGYRDTAAQGRPGSAVCQPNARFTQAACVAVPCDPLVIQTSATTTKTCSALKTDESCSYTCADGYQDSDHGSVACVGVSVGAGQAPRSEFSPAVVSCSAQPCTPVTIHHTAGTALAGVDKVCTANTDQSCSYKCADGHQDSLSSLAWNDPSYSGSAISCKGVPVANGMPARSEFQPPPLQAATCDPLPCTPITIEHTTDPSGRTLCTGHTGDSCTAAAPVPAGYSDYTCAPGYTASRATRTVLCRPNLADHSAFEEPDRQPTDYPRPELWGYCPREYLTGRAHSLPAACSRFQY